MLKPPVSSMSATGNFGNNAATVVAAARLSNASCPSTSSAPVTWLTSGFLRAVGTPRVGPTTRRPQLGRYLAEGVVRERGTADKAPGEIRPIACHSPEQTHAF